MGRGDVIALNAATALSVFLVDQATKWFFAHHYVVGQSLPVIPGIFHLTYVANSGAAFGVFPGARWFLIGVSSIILLAILAYVITQRPTSRWSQAAIGFILGGSVSNLVDRILRGVVVDYFDFRIWPVFNIADTMINVGVFMFLLKLLMTRKEQA